MAQTIKEDSSKKEVLKKEDKEKHWMEHWLKLRSSSEKALL